MTLWGGRRRLNIASKDKWNTCLYISVVIYKSRMSNPGRIQVLEGLLGELPIAKVLLAVFRYIESYSHWKWLTSPWFSRWQSTTICRFTHPPMMQSMFSLYNIPSCIKNVEQRREVLMSHNDSSFSFLCNFATHIFTVQLFSGFHVSRLHCFAVTTPWNYRTRGKKLQ